MNVSELLPAGLNGEAGITVIAAVSAFACVIMIWNALLPNMPVSSRAVRLKRRREELRSGLQVQRGHAMRRETVMAAMKDVTKRLNLLRSEAAGRFIDALARAGWRSREALITFAFLKISLPFAFGAGAFVAFNLMGIGNLEERLQTLAPIAAAVLGAYAPDVFVSNAAKKRQQLIQKGMPDALDLLVICAEAGLSLDAAMTRVAAEMELACPPLADEFGLTAVELGFLPDRRKALENLTRRCPLGSMRGVVTTLMQTEKYGTPLANSLRVLSAEFRNERMLKAEEKAARLPAILTVPMMLFILPTLFVVLGGPAVVKILDTLKGF